MLRVLPCLDSADMATLRRLELAISQEAAAALGRSAVKADVGGYYVSDSGLRVDWRHLVDAAVSAKVGTPPDAVLPRRDSPGFLETRVQASNETTSDPSPQRLFSGPFCTVFASRGD
ncbi:MAG: hypothetical protein GX620_09255 [Chloroflexi bacterium]|nr:hypothetical protein [Chloroflexota bacterium]